MLRARGKESITLNFVGASWLAVTVVFVWKGTAADMMNYGIAVAALLAVWLQREWTEKVSVPKMEQGEATPTGTTKTTTVQTTGTPP